MNIVISAFSCSPHRGSEQGLGFWAVSAALNVFERVTLITRTKRKEELIKFYGNNMPPNLEIISLEVTSVSWLENTFLKPLYYDLWQLKLVFSIPNNFNSRVFLHHVTFASDQRLAGILWAPSDGVRVWGPVGGSGRVGSIKVKWFGFRGFATEHLRNCYFFLVGKRIGRIQSNLADVTLVQNSPHTDWLGTDRVWLSSAQSILPNTRNSRERKLIVGIGRLVPWKGWGYLIESMRLLPDFKLEIYGTGYDKQRLMRLARRHEVTDRVVFKGHVNSAELGKALSKASVLCHPAIHEAAGWAVADAITAGLPVVCWAGTAPEELSAATGHTHSVLMGDEIIQELAMEIMKAFDCQDHVPSPLFTKARVQKKLEEFYLGLRSVI